VIESHPATAQKCSELLRRFRQAFPDLRVDVASITKVGDETRVKWSAHGTNRGSLGGLAPTGRTVNIQGSTTMKIVDGKIVSSTAEWNESDLQKQLGTAAPR
jgi:predicted ester cyclase